MTLTARAGAHRAIVRGRQAMVGLYTDRVVVTRAAIPTDPEYVPPEDRQMDPVTFQYPAEARVVVYKGPARVQVKVDINSNVVEAVVAEREATHLTSQLQTPVEVEELVHYHDRDTFDGTGFMGAPGRIDVDHELEVLSCTYDSAMVGRLFNIEGPFHKSQGTYRRFRMNEAV